MKEFTASQAAALTGLSLSAVRKALDQETIPVRLVRSGRTVERVVPQEALLCLKLEQLGVGRLPLSCRKRIYRTVLEQPAADEWRDSDAVVIRAETARASLNSELQKLRRASARVTSHPEVMGGVPVFRGTRIPVHLIAEMRRQGASVEEILQGYTRISAVDIELAEFYALAHPRRGARRRVRLPKSARFVEERRSASSDAG